MPQQQLLATPYIILRKNPFREAAWIVSGISPTFGRIDFIATGARSISKRRFPLVGLFREYSISFCLPKSQDSQLVSLSSIELSAMHDSIAMNLNAYLAACSVSAFLLRSIPFMCDISPIWNAFSIFLSRVESNAIRPDLSLALFLLVYAREQGILPPDLLPSSHSLESLVAFASSPHLTSLSLQDNSNAIPSPQISGGNTASDLGLKCSELNTLTSWANRILHS